MTGQLIKEYNITSTQSSYSLEDMDNGVYIVSYISDKGISNQKITKLCQ